MVGEAHQPWLATELGEVIQKFLTYFTCRRCEGNVGEAVEQEGKLCDEVETVREFTFCGDRVSASGGCEAAMTVRQDVGWLSLGSAVRCCMAGDFL